MHVVNDGIKIPWMKRATIRIQILSVIAQTRLVTAIIVPPVRIMGFIGYWSAIMPKGRFASAMPNITTETESEAIFAFTANSFWIIGSTGCVIYTVVKAAATNENTST